LDEPSEEIDSVIDHSVDTFIKAQVYTVDPEDFSFVWEGIDSTIGYRVTVCGGFEYSASNPVDRCQWKACHE